MLSQKFPRLIDALRPTFDEIECYARMILQHEGRPPSSLPDCRREAMLQLWVDRSFRSRAARKSTRRSVAA
ncbi:MAG TPA: hypothetical protein VG734_09265 [Lacunisphaera sp.]|nr:hypothetical protein [Lacunisphaera sp.]